MHRIFRLLMKTLIALALFGGLAGVCYGALSSTFRGTVTGFVGGIALNLSAFALAELLSRDDRANRRRRLHPGDGL